MRPPTLVGSEQIHDIRPLLDPDALRLPSPQRMERLRAFCRKIERTRSRDAVLALDDEFHLEPIAPIAPTKF